MLPAELAQDPERLAGFEREAKVLASLNHPNIAHVHGFESATLPDGSVGHFLAMALVPGEDLKVLDFGLAKAWEGRGSASADLSQSPTLAHTGNAAGLILGTAAYMSPEQARSKARSRRRARPDA